MTWDCNLTNKMIEIADWGGGGWCVGMLILSVFRSKSNTQIDFILKSVGLVHTMCMCFIS